MWDSEGAKACTCSGVSAPSRIRRRIDRGYEAAAASSRFSSFFSFSAFFFPLSVFDQSSSKISRNCLAAVALFDDDADFAPLVELERAQAHAAEKHLLTVAQYRPHVQTQSGHFLDRQTLASLADFADDANVDARLHALLQQLDHLRDR